MTYEPIYIKFPEPELDQPILSFVCNNYLSVDFYETDEEDSGKSFNELIKSADLPENVAHETFSKFDSYGNRNSTFIANTDYSQENSLFFRESIYRDAHQDIFIKNFRSGYKKTIEYLPLNPKSTAFYPSKYNADLSSPSAYWNSGTAAFGNISSLDDPLKIHSINANITDGITISSINILRNFYHDQIMIFKKSVHRQDTNDLFYASGSTEYTNLDQGDVKAKLNNVLKDANDVHTQNVKVELGESKITNATGKINFLNLPKEAVNVKLLLTNKANQSITLDCLVDDFYVSVTPIRSKTSKLNRFMEQHALCYPLEYPMWSARGYKMNNCSSASKVENNLYGTDAGGSSVRSVADGSYGVARRLDYRFDAGPYIGTRTWPSFSQYRISNKFNNGIFAGFKSSLVTGDTEHSTRDMRYGEWNGNEYERWLPEEKGLLIHTPSGAHKDIADLFDYLRYSIYASRLEYKTKKIYYDSSRTYRIPDTDEETIYHNAYERPQMVSHGRILHNPDVTYPRLGYDMPDPLDTVFVHTYYLKVSFYPKRINILDSSLKELTETEKTAFGLQQNNQSSHEELKKANQLITLVNPVRDIYNHLKRYTNDGKPLVRNPSRKLDEYGNPKSDLKARIDTPDSYVWQQDSEGSDMNSKGEYKDDGFHMYRLTSNPKTTSSSTHAYLIPKSNTNAYNERVSDADRGYCEDRNIGVVRPLVERNSSLSIKRARSSEAKALTFSYLEANTSITLKDDTKDRISRTGTVTHSSELDQIVPSITVVGASSRDFYESGTSSGGQLLTPVVSINSEIDLAQNKIVYTWFDRGATKNVKIAIDEINELGGASRLMQYQFGSADGIINVVRGKTTFSFNEDKTELTHNITEDVLKRTATANDSNLRYKFTISTFNGQEESDPISTIVEVNPDLESVQSSLIPYTPGLSLKTTTAKSATFDFIMSYDTSTYSDYRQQFDTIVVEYYESPESKQQFSIERSSLSDTGNANTFKTSFTIDGLLSNKRYKFAATAINRYGESDSSREIDASTPAIGGKSKLKLSSNQNRQSNLNQTILNIESIGIKPDSDSLLDIELKYKKGNTTYPINTGALSIASSQPIKDLIKRTKDTIELILVGFPGLYKIEATPIFQILGRGETVYIDVNIVHRAPGKIVQNRKSKQFNSKLLFADYSIIPLKDAGFYTSSAANQSDSDVTVSTKANLFFTTADVSTVEIMKPGYRTRTDSSLVEDISISFKPNDINYTFKPQHLVPLVTPGTTAYSNFGKIDLQPSFKFVIQKVTGQENQLVCVLGPDPFLRYDMSTGQMDRGPSVLNNIGNGTELLGGQFSRIRRQDGQTLPFKRHWNSLIPNLNQERINHAEYALFYLKLNNGENRFTNYYNYDKTTDTLYLQIMSNEAKQYVSIQNLIGVQVGSIQIPGSTNKQSIEYDSETIGKNPTNSIQFYEMLNTFLANNISGGSKQIKIKTKATIPDYLQDNAQATTTAVSVHTQPDNGFYAVTERETGRNFYNAKLSEDVLSNNSSALPQSWENLSNLPRNVLYEDSGFYIISDPAFTNDQSDQTISLNAPAIISISQNDGVGDQYQGFSVVTVKAKYEGTGNSKIDLNLFSFLGYVVEKYVDNEWVQINTLESSTEFFENNNFEGTFSFKIFLVDGAVKYRAFVKVKNIDGTIFKGKNVLIDKQIDNLLTEDFD